MRDGIPVRRARIRVPDTLMFVSERTIDPQLGERLRSFLEERPLSHVVLNSDLYPGIIDAIRAAIPAVAVLCLGRDLPVYLPRLILEHIAGGRLETSPARHPGHHWNMHGEELTEFYELVHKTRPTLMLDVVDLTPDVPRRGMEGDIFIDQLCYYRAPYQGKEAALAGASSCTFCAIPQATRRPHPPDLEVAAAQIDAYLAADPNARVFHVMDYGVLGHIAELAKVISRAPVSGLELCSSVRAPDILAYHAEIEAALPIFAASGHRFHIFNIGFETFSEVEFERLNKGYPVLQNTACIRYLTQLEERFPESFAFSRWGAHGFIGTTCWSSLADLRINAFFGHALGFARLSNRFFLRKLRLYPQLPLYEMARRDGLLADEYVDWRLDNAQWTGYAGETPYRFLHRETEHAYRWATRLLIPESEIEQQWNSVLRSELAENGADDWELVVYAAVLHEVQRSGIDNDMSEAEFVDAVRSAARLPTLDLFPSTDLPDDASAFPAGPPPQTALVGARECDLLVRGMKPTIKVELLDRVTADRLAGELEAQGFHAKVLNEVLPLNLARLVGRDSEDCRQGRRILVAGREAGDVDRLSGLLGDTIQDYPDHARSAGNLLGYPECCVSAYASLPQWVLGADVYLLAASVARTSGLIHAELDPFAPGAVTEYFPCRMDCPASLTRARQASGQDEMKPPGAVLVLSPLSRIELEDVVDEPLGWRYGAARLQGSSPWGEHILGYMQKGDRVEVLERLLLVYLGWELLAAIPHGVIVPMAYGAANRFPWLADVTRQVAPLVEDPVAPLFVSRPTPPAETTRELPDLVAGPLGGRAVASVRVDGGSIIVDLVDDGLGEVALELRRADLQNRSYLRAGAVAVSYRLPPGVEFSPAVGRACRDLLRWAELHSPLVEAAFTHETPGT